MQYNTIIISVFLLHLHTQLKIMTVYYSGIDVNIIVAISLTPTLILEL